MKIRLSKRVIDKAKYEGRGGCYLWDTEILGFGLRIYPTGRKSFVVTYHVRGRQRYFTIGRFGELTVQQARALSLETLAEARQGKDPAGEYQTSRKAPTMVDLADRFMNDHALIKKKPKSAARDRQLWDRCVLPELGKRKVHDIRRNDVAKLLTAMADTPAMANKVQTLLSKAFNLAEIWEWRPEGSNPCRHVGRFKEQSRERYLSHSELERLGQVLTRMEAERAILPQAIAAIRLLVLTGCRSAEILKLKWTEVDFERRCLALEDSKTGRRTVMLNEAALEIIDDLPRVGPYVIPGRTPDRPLSTLQHLWKRIRAEADLEDVRIHDIRHTYASFGVNNGHNLAVVGKLLGHSKIQTTQRYAHLADDPLRQANEQIGSGLAASLQGSGDGHSIGD